MFLSTVDGSIQINDGNVGQTNVSSVMDLLKSLNINPYVSSIVFTIISIVVTLLAILLAYNIAVNGINIRGWIILKGLRRDLRDSNSDSIDMIDLRDKMAEFRAMFRKDMMDYIRRHVHIHDPNITRCPDHLRALDFILVDQIFDYMFDNHVEEKAVCNSDTKKGLNDMFYQIEHDYLYKRNTVCKDTDLISFDYEIYRHIIEENIYRFYEKYQREALRMFENTLDHIVAHEHRFKTERCLSWIEKKKKKYSSLIEQIKNSIFVYDGGIIKIKSN